MVIRKGRDIYTSLETQQTACRNKKVGTFNSTTYSNGIIPYNSFYLIYSCCLVSLENMKNRQTQTQTKEEGGGHPKNKKKKEKSGFGVVSQSRILPAYFPHMPRDPTRRVKKNATRHGRRYLTTMDVLFSSRKRQ